MRAHLHRTRAAVTLIELLVVVAIIGVLASLVATAIQTARVAAARAECVNNLSQIGVAMQLYQNQRGAFPTEADQAGTAGASVMPSFYQSILPYVEQQYRTEANPSPAPRGGSGLCFASVSLVAQQQISAQAYAPAPGIRLFLCPGRRTPAVGPKRDYGYASSLSASAAGPSILDSPVPIRPAMITRGPANTYLLTHAWMSPKTYFNGTDPTDLGWATRFNSRTSTGNPRYDSDPAGNLTYLGGPHPNLLPTLFADGHVASLNYEVPNFPQGWACTVALPADTQQVAQQQAFQMPLISQPDPAPPSPPSDDPPKQDNLPGDAYWYVNVFATNSPDPRNRFFPVVGGKKVTKAEAMQALQQAANGDVTLWWCLGYQKNSLTEPITWVILNTPL